MTIEVPDSVEHNEYNPSPRPAAKYSSMLMRLEWQRGHALVSLAQMLETCCICLEGIGENGMFAGSRSDVHEGSQLGAPASLRYRRAMYY